MQLAGIDVTGYSTLSRPHSADEIVIDRRRAEKQDADRNVHTPLKSIKGVALLPILHAKARPGSRLSCRDSVGTSSCL